MNFDKSVEIILDVEKGLVKNPKDPGGTTNFGISQRSYPDLNIETLTKDQAIAIYKRDFWDKYLVDQMPEVLRLMFFDCAVNQGQHFAAVTLQGIVTAPVDGLIGPTTLQRIYLFHDLELLEKFAKARLERYVSNKDYALDGVGWIRRLVAITFNTLKIDI